MTLLSSEEFHELSKCSNGHELRYGDKSGPMLYASRYSLDVLRAKQDQIIRVFSESLELRDEEWGRYFSRKDGQELVGRDWAIIAELTILNNAIIFSEESPKLSGRWLQPIIDFYSDLVNQIRETVKDWPSLAKTLVEIQGAFTLYPLSTQFDVVSKMKGFMTKAQKEQFHIHWKI